MDGARLRKRCVPMAPPRVLDRRQVIIIVFKST
jgi:hypothetical protein